MTQRQRQTSATGSAISVRWNEVSGEVSIHVTTIRHLDDENDKFGILDFVENPERSLTDSIARVLPRELFATMGSRIVCEPSDFLNYALTRFF